MAAKCNGISVVSESLYEDADALHDKLLELYETGRLPLYRGKVNRRKLGSLLRYSCKSDMAI